MTTSDHFLFVSHVSEDRAAAMEIVAELERRGLPCWIAPRDVGPGKPFDDEIADAIDASLAMLLIFSERCNESEYIRREVTVAGESQKVIVPFRIENAPPRRGLRVRLADLHWIDGFVSREQAIDDLMRTFKPPKSERPREAVADTATHPPTGSSEIADVRTGRPQVEQPQNLRTTPPQPERAKARQPRAEPDETTGVVEETRHRPSANRSVERFSRGRWFVTGLVLSIIIVGLWLAKEATAPPPNTDPGIDAINVRNDRGPIDLTNAIGYRISEGGRVAVSTAPGYDGIVRRMEVRARESGKDWGVFALANTGDEQIDRLLVAPHYWMIGSGMLMPDLGQSRIVNITPSAGAAPERQSNANGDVFQMTLDPGTVVTFVAELRTASLPQVQLWKPDAYSQEISKRSLSEEVVLGAAGVIVLFLSILCITGRNPTILASAALGWAVLLYIGIAFSFLGAAFSIPAASAPVWRATSELLLAMALLGPLLALRSREYLGQYFLNIALGGLLLLVICFAAPPVGSLFARLLFFLIVVVGASMLAGHWLRRDSRALLLLPSWTFLVIWTLVAALSVLGVITNGAIEPLFIDSLLLLVVFMTIPALRSLWHHGTAHQLRRA